MPKRPRKLDTRDLAAEIVRRAKRDGEGKDGGGRLPYVVDLGEPPTPHQRVVFAACKILGHAVAIMPTVCGSVQEWCEQYAKTSRS